MRVLVTGATGFIGKHLVQALVERGDTVRALVRNPERGKEFPAGVEIRVGDLGEPESLRGITEDTDIIYHLGSIMRGSWSDFERVDIEGSRLLLDLAKQTGVRRFVYTSTLAVYPLASLRDGATVSDATPVDRPERVASYARAKLAVEEMLRAAHRAGEIEGVVVRPGLVYGPGTSPYLSHLPHLGKLRGDRYLVFGDGKVPLALTYVGNTVDALLLCGSKPAAAGNTFTIVDDETPTQRQFVDLLAELTGRPLQLGTIPKPAGYVLGLTVEALAALRRKRPGTTRRLILGKTAKLRFDSSRARTVLGWRPAVGVREGLTRAVQSWDRDSVREAQGAAA